MKARSGSSAISSFTRAISPPFTAFRKSFSNSITLLAAFGRPPWLPSLKVLGKPHTRLPASTRQSRLPKGSRSMKPRSPLGSVRTVGSMSSTSSVPARACTWIAISSSATNRGAACGCGIAG